MKARLATTDDVPFLWHMLTLAASMTGTSEDIARAQCDPDLRCYVEGFGRLGDLGMIAFDEAPIGAAWIRHGEPHSTKVWSSEIRELAIATRVRGQGVGSLLLRTLLEAAGDGPIGLSVREGNPAVRLYERHGFREERRVVNRVDGVSLVMLKAR